MPRIALALIGPVLAGLAAAQTLEKIDPDALRQRPVTTVPGPAGDLVRQWWKAGTAAGNIGDYYDNRDGDHSPLDRSLFPQLAAVRYSPDDIKLRKHWAAQSVLLPAVVFGNSSTSAPPTQGGSNPRHYYCSTRGLNFLAREYTGNNVYIYPEHRDHDPGHNGKGDGFGDLYPTNTPYLIISQGSSGSDQPFMRAVPLALAALRPEVKKKLTETGTLMPALQMLLRRTSRRLKGPGEYLTGRAHPSVFEGGWVDDLAMVKLAHGLELRALPPVVQLRVVEESGAAQGVDYFDPGLTERLADTPAVIARVHRSKERTRRLVVSAEGSQDLNGAPLTYSWVVLRGSAGRVRIAPRNPAGSVVEIAADYQERRPVARGSTLESNRVDVGVFVHNGTHYSAPAFVTFYTLDNESRLYDAEGRIREIAYGMGEVDLRVKDWDKVLAALAQGDAAGGLFGLDAARRGVIAEAAARYRECGAVLREAQARVKEAEAAVQKAANEEKDAPRQQADAARKRRADAEKALAAVLDEPRPVLGGSLRSFVETTCRRLAADEDFFTRYAPLLAGAKVAQSAAAQQRLKALVARGERLGVLGSAARGPTSPFARAVREQVHLTALADLAFPGAADVVLQENFVDRRLTTPKHWRDVYRYDGAGHWLGWTRFHPDRGAEEFSPAGLPVGTPGG